jgi:hypothetical protein
MKHPKSASIRQLLETLREAGVEFIVVGGAAATMHGSGTTTEDLDIVPRPTPENIDRLLALLERLDAHFRADAAGRRLRPARSHLEGGGQLLLSTLLGPLDLLMRLHDGRGYDEIVHYSQVFTDDHIDIEVVRLPELIEIKRQAGRDKDKAVLPILVALLKRLEAEQSIASPSPDARKPKAEDSKGEAGRDDRPNTDSSDAPPGGREGGTPSAG